MMGALNVRRGGRSPPLLVVALVACILLIGFNYWVSSSRNVDLQARLLELEEMVRRTSAERTREQVGRNEVEKQLHRRTEQLALLEGAHLRRQETAQSLWNQEKESLLLNISSSAKTVQDMIIQMNSLRENLSKVQMELESCQNNLNSLNKKVMYDMTQCNTQILALKEECNENVAAAKIEVQKYQKQRSTTNAQKDVVITPVQEMPPGNLSLKSSREHLQIEPDLEANHKSELDLKTNDLLQEKAVLRVNDSDKLEFTSAPSVLRNNTLMSQTNVMMNMTGGNLKGADALLGVSELTKRKEEEAIEYGNEGEIEKRLSKLKDEKVAAQEFDDELADYNGDDENQPEFEADKQAELSEI